MTVIDEESEGSDNASNSFEVKSPPPVEAAPQLNLHVMPDTPETTSSLGGEGSEKKEGPIISACPLDMPDPRMKAAMFVKGHSLVIFGGLREEKGQGDKEITYDDCWSLDLHARDRWLRRKEGSMQSQRWFGSESSEDESAQEGWEEWSDTDPEDNDSQLGTSQSKKDRMRCCNLQKSRLSAASCFIRSEF
jgi:hypothetical protein